MMAPMGLAIVIIAVTFAIALALMLWVRRSGAFGMSKAKMQQAQNLVATGQKARAKILRIDPTGMIVNEINIQCLVTFQLEPIHGGAPFDAQKKMMINQTQMPRVGDVWPAWYDAADPTQFAVGMPDGASPEQIPIFREFGIPHPLDPSTGGAAGGGAGNVAALERLAQLRRDGTLTEAEFQAEKAKLLGS